MWCTLGQEAVVPDEVGRAEVDLLQGLLDEWPNLRLHFRLGRFGGPRWTLYAQELVPIFRPHKNRNLLTFAYDFICLQLIVNDTK